MIAMMCYPFPLFLIFYRSGNKPCTQKPSSIRILIETTSRHIKLTPCLWYHCYTRHLHLVCPFNYLLLAIFLSVFPFWFIGLYINSGLHYSFMFRCKLKDLFLITSLFELFGRDSKKKNTLRSGTFVPWNFSGFVVDIFNAWN